TAVSGVATFTDLGTANDEEVADAQLAYNAAGLAEITSAKVTLPAPLPAHTATAAAHTLAPEGGDVNTITLKVKNAVRKTALTLHGVVDVTISGVEQAPDGSYGSFNGTALTADAAGVGQTISVTFTNGVATPILTLHKADAQTVGFSVTGVATPATNNVTIT